MDNLPAILFIGFVFGGSTIGYVVNVIASKWRDVRVAEQNAVLKKDMLERGFTAADIVRVLEAGTPPEAVAEDPDLIETMVEKGYTGDDLALAAAALDRVPAGQREAAVRAAVGMAENSYDGDDIVKFLDSRAGTSPAPVPTV